jgi:hypothetical protein
LNFLNFCELSKFSGGLAIAAMRQLPLGFFFENAWNFKDFFREFEVFETF